MPAVLVVEDYASSRHLFVRTLEAGGYCVRAAATGAEALACLDAGPFDAALIDIRLPDLDGIEVARHVRARFPATPIVIITSFPDYWAACRAMTLLPEAWLDKPVEPSVLLETLAAVITGRTPLPVLARPPAGGLPAADFDGMVGQSPAMLAVYRRIAVLGPMDAPVLVRGETGTGKDLVARALHLRSARRTGPFEPVQISAIPATLFEEQMFGHEAGAFTDARAARAGWFEAAHRGTLFLDEIGELSPGAQARLLRVLEDAHVTLRRKLARSS